MVKMPSVRMALETGGGVLRAEPAERMGQRRPIASQFGADETCRHLLLNVLVCFVNAATRRIVRQQIHPQSCTPLAETRSSTFLSSAQMWPDALVGHAPKGSS